MDTKPAPLDAYREATQALLPIIGAYNVLYETNGVTEAQKRIWEMAKQLIQLLDQDLQHGY